MDEFYKLSEVANHTNEGKIPAYIFVTSKTKSSKLTVPYPT